MGYDGDAERWDDRPPRGLTEAEIRLAVGRCPELTRWAFEGWLRGTHALDGDLVAQ